MFNIEAFNKTIVGLSKDDLYSLWDQLELAIANCKSEDTKKHLEAKLDAVVSEHVRRNRNGKGK